MSANGGGGSFRFKVSILGDSGVGKTALALGFTGRQPPTKCVQGETLVGGGRVGNGGMECSPIPDLFLVLLWLF